MKSKGNFLLAGSDSEGDSRESWHVNFDRAFEIGMKCMVSDKDGPAWKGFSIWGNDEQTGEWRQLEVKP